MTAETTEGTSLFQTRKIYMPQPTNALGSEMVLGPDKKLGLIRDTSIQPFAPKEETIEIDLPQGVREAVIKASLSYQPRPGNVYPLQEQVLRVGLDR